MTAKDLFEKFGFKLDEYETQTNNAIVAYTRGEGWMKEKIIFHDLIKSVIYKDLNRQFQLNIGKIKAIYEQAKELGWLGEKE